MMDLAMQERNTGRSKVVWCITFGVALFFVEFSAAQTQPAFFRKDIPPGSQTVKAVSNPIMRSA